MPFNDGSSGDVAVNTLSSILGVFGAIMGVIWLIVMIINIVTIVAMWKVMKKAGKPGWVSLIPFYNTYMLFDMVYPGNGIRFLFLLIPFYNIYVLIKYQIDLAKAFGQSSVFAVGLIFLGPIFMAILGFGSSEYQLSRHFPQNGNLKNRTMSSKDEALERLRKNKEHRDNTDK